MNVRDRHGGHLTHDFKRVPLLFFRKHFTALLTEERLREERANTYKHYKISDDELRHDILVRDLVGVVLQGNGYYRLNNLTKDSYSRYYRKTYKVKGTNRWWKYQSDIRVADHPDWKRNADRVTINYRYIYDSDDSIHLAVSRAIKCMMF